MQHFNTEEEVVILLRIKNKEALNLLYDKYAGALYALILDTVKDEESAYEILEKSFCFISKNAASYDPTKCRLFTWMLQVTKKMMVSRKLTPSFQD